MSKIDNWHPLQLKKIKSLGAVLELNSTADLATLAQF